MRSTRHLAENRLRGSRRKTMRQGFPSLRVTRSRQIFVQRHRHNSLAPVCRRNHNTHPTSRLSIHLNSFFVKGVPTVIHSFYTGVVPAMEKRKLQRLTRQELKTLVANKDNLDHDFPEHSKTIESTDFWEIAQKKTSKNFPCHYGQSKLQARRPACRLRYRKQDESLFSKKSDREPRRQKH